MLRDKKYKYLRSCLDLAEILQKNRLGKVRTYRVCIISLANIERDGVSLRLGPAKLNSRTKHGVLVTEVL